MRVGGALVVCAANRCRGGAKGVDDQPAGVVVGAADRVDPAHRRISLKSSTASSLTVRTSPTFVPAQASKLRRPLGPGIRLGRGCWTVFSTLTRPPLLQGCRAFEIRQIVRCQRIDDASGMDFINGGKPVGRERHPPAIGSAQPFQPTRVEQPEP
jgi:hypothetical protein